MQIPGTFAFFLGGGVLAIALLMGQQGHERPGYDDTPVLPGSRFRVHDSRRPYPRVVTPGTGATPPSDATVLFDGTSLDPWQRPDGQPATWELVDGAMQVHGGTIETKQHFGDCQLHIEWASPGKVAGRVRGHGQGRGNSGVFLMGRYEIQVLDSFASATYADGQAAAIYGQFPPLVNACRPAGAWQSYDIVFEAPRFAKKKLVRPAYVTVLHNGVIVHHHQALLGSTQYKRLAHYEPHAETGPLRLQDHGCPVRYRNIWVRPLGSYDTANDK